MARSQQVAEFLHYLPVDRALEWNDQLDETIGLDPPPGFKFRFGRCNIDLAVVSLEANQEPVLGLAAKAPAPKPLTLEVVRAVLAEKSRSGHTTKIRELLEKHGAAKLSEIDPAKYATLLAEAEVLGDG